MSFCRVVDNYGDAGVCWRLARQLAAEHALDVTLWIDRLATLARFEPGDRRATRAQSSRGVDVRRLDDRRRRRRCPTSSSKAFGCGLAAALRRCDGGGARRRRCGSTSNTCPPSRGSTPRMASRRRIRDCRLTRHFWFPGFTPHTGGLLREAGLARGARSRACRRIARRRRAAAHRAVLLSEPRAAGAVRRVGRRRRADRVRDSRRRRHRRARSRGCTATCRTPASRSRAAAWRSTSIPFMTQDAFDRLLWRSRRQFRARRGFVRARAMGRARVRLAAVPAGRECASAEARRVPRALCGRAVARRSRPR